MTVTNLEDVAIVIRPERDNLAVVTADFLEPGTELRYRDQLLGISARALRGQSFAVAKVEKGAPYITLGDPIGIASRDVQAGEPIDVTNLEDRLPKLSVRSEEHTSEF